jgi:hypothetical protein
MGPASCLMILPEDLLGIAEGDPAPAGPHPDAALLDMNLSHAHFIVFIGTQGWSLPLLGGFA